MTDQDTLDQQVLSELRPPVGGPQGLDEIVMTLTAMRRHGVELPPISPEGIAGSLARLSARRQVVERHGTWEFTPVDSARQRSLF
jgi:hypothetical protein